MSPTQRSLALLRKRGYFAEVVERWIPRINVRKDYAGIIDIIALGEKEIIGVQSTSASNVSARVQKITEHENTPILRKAGIRILVHGWGKRANGRYALREIDLS